MKVRIHRGAHEVGGNCVELESQGQRIVLDLGKPLTAAWGEEVPLPAVDGLADGGDPTLLGVFISHGHQDHWGLMPQVHPTVPRFIGKGAADILRAALWWGSGIDLEETGHFEHRVPMTVGPFTVTPFLNDHSAFDAYSLLIQADGQSLFYTGDIRGHGRKGSMFEQLLDEPPRDVDVLLCEGTNVHPEGSEGEKGSLSEAEVERELAQTLRVTDGLVVVLSSPQNIDRVVTTYRAALQADRDLALDLYSCDVVAGTGLATIPQLGPDWPRVHAYLPLHQRIKVKNAAAFEKTQAVRPYRIYDERLSENPERYVLFGSFQQDLLRLLRSASVKVGAVVWSQWDGYLEKASGVKLQETLKKYDVPLIQHHTSGHATPADLERLISAINPTAVVPVHTEHPGEFEGITSDVDLTIKADGHWWEVA